jgi:exopolyphosphatase/guanosine-5'-triphosphate,3'-diphosphate pyrophosphatase
MTDQRAIIDIGSNTVRLVIYGGPPRAPEVIYNEKVTAKLGRGVADSGSLGKKASAAALSALGRYATILNLQGVTHVDAVATAAVRDAANGEAFLAQVRALGLKPRLLTGEEEAITAAYGVMAAFPGAKGLIGDLGGGSLELTHIDGDNCTHGSSMPLGTLRLPKLRAGGPAAFMDSIADQLAAADWKGAQAEPFYLVGGSWRALARYAAFRQGWPVDDPHGYIMTPAALLEIAEFLGQTKEKITCPGLSASRAASLPDASALLAVLVRKLAPTKLVFSSWGLREGLIYRQLGNAARAQDPLLSGVTAFARQQGITPTVAATIANWTANVSGTGDPSRERLRLAATALALASMRIEPNLRGNLALDWGLRKRWIGIDDAGRAMLTMAILANGGRSAIPAELTRLTSSETLHEAIVWGFATRLCRRFSGTSAKALAQSTLRAESGRLVFAVEPAMHALCTEPVEKDLRLLAGSLGLAPDMQLLPS